MDGFMISILERCTAPGEGILGGGTAHPTHGYMESKIHGNVQYQKTPSQPFAAGDLLSIRTGGGGGWGSPLTRDVNSVLRDVQDGYVSIESARADYGVAISSTGEVDSEETATLRA